MTTSQSTTFASPADRESVRRCGEGYHVEIDVRRQPTIESELSPARGFPPPQGREIEIGKADRLLELVRSITRDKHPGHMGLPANHVGHRVRIGANPAQELDLLIERRLVFVGGQQLLAHHAVAGGFAAACRPDLTGRDR